MDSVKKQDAGGNRSSTKGLVSTAAKLDNETEVFAHETVSSELKKQIQSARLAKKMTQAQVRRRGSGREREREAGRRSSGRATHAAWPGPARSTHTHGALASPVWSVSSPEQRCLPPLAPRYALRS